MEIKKIGLLLIVFAVAGLFLGGCSTSEKSTKNIKIEYDTEKANTQSTTTKNITNHINNTQSAPPQGAEQGIINQALSVNDSDVEIGDLI